MTPAGDIAPKDYQLLEPIVRMREDTIRNGDPIFASALNIFQLGVELGIRWSRRSRQVDDCGGQGAGGSERET